MKIKTLALLSIFSLPYLQAEDHLVATPSHKTELKLTYSSLKELIDSLETKAEMKKSPPPVPATIRSSRYQINITSDKIAEVTADFAVSVFTEDWSKIPLLDDHYSISEILPASTLLVSDEGMLCLLKNETGEHKTTLKFLITANPDGSFDINFPRSVASQLHFENIEGYEVRGAIQTEGGSYMLPHNGTDAKLLPKQTAIAKASTWSADSKALYIVADDELKAEARIQLTANQGDSASSARLILPENSRILTVSGADLAEWKSASENKLELTWDTHGISRRRVNVCYSVPLPDTDETWSLGIPQLGNDQATKGQIAVVTPPELQLVSEDSLPTLDPSSAPDWMKAEGIPFIVKLPEAETVNVTCKRLSQMQTATAMIKIANFTTQIVADGSTLSSGEIVIQHSDPKPFILNLPEGSEILTCSIDKKPTSPVILSDGSLQIKLTNKSKTSEQTSKINLAYTSKLSEIDPIEGKLSLSLPSTPLFIHQLTWNIILPQQYEVTALEGNLEFSANSQNSNTISLIKQLSRNDAAQTDIFYRKQNL